MTLTTENEPASTKADQKSRPTAIKYFLVYLSPRYPNIGLNTIKLIIKEVCNNPASLSSTLV